MTVVKFSPPIPNVDSKVLVLLFHPHNHSLSKETHMDGVKTAQEWYYRKFIQP